MPRRPTELQFYEHRLTCPYCRADIVFTSLTDHIMMSRISCPVCKREILIEDGRAVRVPSKGGKKPPRRVRSR